MMTGVDRTGDVDDRRCQSGGLQWFNNYYLQSRVTPGTEKTEQDNPSHRHTAGHSPQPHR